MLQQREKARSLRRKMMNQNKEHPHGVGDCKWCHKEWERERSLWKKMMNWGVTSNPSFYPKVAIS